MRNYSKHTWFEFNGHSCREMGAWLMSAPISVRPAWRGDALTAIGRDGDVFVTDDTRGSYEIRVCIRTYLSNRERVDAWLTGSGRLSFSWRIDRECPARIIKGQSWKIAVPGTDPIIEADVYFACQPWFYARPPVGAITITSSGTDIFHPGTIAALPMVKITGSGNFSVSIGSQTIYFDSIVSGIIVDSEMGDAYSLDATTNMNNSIMGLPWEIQPGTNTVSWSLETGASLTSIEITPKWRYSA